MATEDDGVTDRLMRDLPPPSGLDKLKDDPNANKDEGDDDGGDAALESAASDVMAAFHGKDVGALKDALHDFVKNCQDDEGEEDESGKGY